MTAMGSSMAVALTGVQKARLHELKQERTAAKRRWLAACRRDDESAEERAWDDYDRAHEALARARKLYGV